MKPQKSAGREFLLNVAAARRHRRRLYSNKISRRHSALAGDGPSAGGANEPERVKRAQRICNQLVIKQSRTGFNPRIPNGFARLGDRLSVVLPHFAASRLIYRD
jgi:hypothetical protein